ncbi:MAG: endonuclease/exonuclease/phosphatase family protein [Bacteroidales bacterium]|nr:endonuclease/exonuclease/phosphatase family protein [Bacteroidales bacterium]MCK9498371.1 endonuclease/exonuclease/phosphatase family protein [Bacteroidales bacterium]MDY0316017.1 endonuclease/exonuclease/phosphatase family protein [Bacteroidales bacterium]NLB86381.1 endonuclease/exonuclease/phosphatase family protein [Bacteroidales bacterium]
MKKLVLLSVFLILIFSNLFSQEAKEYKVVSLAFYNVENLFDTIPGKNDREFTPVGNKKWDTPKYYAKLDTLASVISKIGRELTNTAPAVVGLSEIENLIVLEDLVEAKDIKKYNYQIVHFDGPDYRGVDCAFLYRPEYFTLTNVAMHSVYTPDDPGFRTRDQLLVSGVFDGEEMHFIVLHWPSRYGGEKRSAPKRFAAADVTRSIVDSILEINSKAKIVIMGDLNDDPDSKSVKNHLKTQYKKEKTKLPYLYNTMESLYRNGIGSLAYRDKWNLFDQIIITPEFLEKDKSSYRFYQAHVFNKSFLMQKEGRFKGYPLRTYVGDTYVGGYSDHFPTYIYLIKEK